MYIPPWAPSTKKKITNDETKEDRLLSLCCARYPFYTNAIGSPRFHHYLILWLFFQTNNAANRPKMKNKMMVAFQLRDTGDHHLVKNFHRSSQPQKCFICVSSSSLVYTYTSIALVAVGKKKLTLACDDFQPLGAYFPSLFSGSTNRYSPSGKQKRNKTFIDNCMWQGKDEEEGRRKHTQMVFDPGLFLFSRRPSASRNVLKKKKDGRLTLLTSIIPHVGGQKIRKREGAAVLRSI